MFLHPTLLQVTASLNMCDLLGTLRPHRQYTNVTSIGGMKILVSPAVSLIKSWWQGLTIIIKRYTHTAAGTVRI